MPIVVGGGAAQSPGLSTYSALKTRVARYVQMPDDAEGLDVAGQEINDAIRELNTRTWYWALTSQTLTLVADTQDYNLAANYKAARNLRWATDSAYGGNVGYVDPKTFDLDVMRGAGTGSPCAYSIYNFLDTYTLTFDCPTSAGHIASLPYAVLRYHARVPTLVSDADTVPVPSEVELFIVWKARAGMALQYDKTKYGQAEGKADRFWHALVRDDNENHFHDWS